MGASCVHKFFLGNIFISKEPVVAPEQRKINRLDISLLVPTWTAICELQALVNGEKSGILVGDGERGMGGYPGSHMERNEGFPTMRTLRQTGCLYFIRAHVH
jgi:hypothetical protein